MVSLPSTTLDPTFFPDRTRQSTTLPPSDILSLTVSNDQSLPDKLDRRNLYALKGHTAFSHDSPLTSSSWGTTGLGSVPSSSFGTTSPMPLLDPSIPNMTQQLSSPEQQMDWNPQSIWGSTSPIPIDTDSKTPDHRQDAIHTIPTHQTQHRPAKRSHLTRCLDDTLDQLEPEELQEYLRRIRRKLDLDGIGEKKDRAYRYKVLYRITDYLESVDAFAAATTTKVTRLYQDPPEWEQRQDGKRTIRCTSPVTNLELFLEKNKNISFLVYRDYTQPGSRPQPRLPLMDDDEQVPDGHEAVHAVNQDLSVALLGFLEKHSEYHVLAENWHESNEVSAPYLFYYHHRRDFDAMVAESTEPTKQHLNLFIQYVRESQKQSYEQADSLLSKNLIVPQYVSHLFKPGQVVVCFSDGDAYSGWFTNGWPRKGSVIVRLRTKSTEESDDPTHEKDATSKHTSDETASYQTDQVRSHEWLISVWRWKFDGVFQRETRDLLFWVEQELDVREDDLINEDPLKVQKRAVPISSLAVVPFDLCEDDVKKQLAKRGRTMWQCRDRQFMSYAEEPGARSTGEQRYMIDFMTYRKLHQRSQTFRNTGDLPQDALDADECPAWPFEVLVEPWTKGFNIRWKEWHDLWIDDVSDIQWKKDAFSKVVMEFKSKEVVRALISKQITVERSTDLIAGKGNGLVLLLHGGPGTGKTLTAESVAEIAEKPLYRVTPGDAGTQAEAVEKYLQSVFYLGKLWGCVVLIDEADVFLEQRDLKDLQRNALVSVFLRHLEYYEGILILTSNRVGTFDDAFRSRIQLALHYPSLDQNKRARIWENFIDRLETFKDDSVNVRDLRAHLDELSAIEMNGREIRNVITTARQYADYIQTTMTYAHLWDVIEISGRFDKYLANLRGGLTLEELAKEEGVR